VSVAAFNSPTTVTILFGLLTLMLLVTAALVSVVGEYIVQKLKASSRFRKFTEKDVAQLKQIRVYYISYSVAQVACAVGQFTVTLFSAPINDNTSGPVWIWAGVAFPGLLFAVAFLFVILAFKRKGKRLLQANYASSSPVLEVVDL
jgi:hypothetical protein